LLEYLGEDRLELYNLAHDPSETTNLVGDHRREAARLQEMLHRWREAVGAQMPVANPDYRPKEPARRG
jgi:hypothetical protein